VESIWELALDRRFPANDEVSIMQRRQRLWSAALSCTILSLSAAGHAALSGASDPHVGFEASGPAGMKINGTTADLAVSEDVGGHVIVIVPLSNLTTGIALRDHHMKEKYLEVAKYPAATLTIARAALNLPAPGQKVEGDAPATLVLHGQTRPVSVHYDAKAEDGAFSTRGKFRINMNEFGISVPSYLGVTVKPDVDVSASFRVAGS
jgi:polyisoprenoid-binding protein YceI